MRLIDRVMVAPDHLLGYDGAGRLHRLPAPGRLAPDVKRCPLRYVVDPTASQQCAELIRTEPNLLLPESPFLRAPAEEFWMEWFETMEADCGLERRGRLAVLARCDCSGRRGSFSFFFEDGPSGISLSPLVLSYDLDGRPVAGSDQFGLVHGEFSHVDRLLRCAWLSFDTAWRAALETASAAQRRDFLVAQARSIWAALPMMLAFSVLLGSVTVVDQRPSALGKLNIRRQRRGERPLLDHIEVGMRLGESYTGGEPASGTGSRTAPRLHYVRGHSVHRGGKTFWRVPHLRGDIHRQIADRTVSVRGGRTRPSERAGPD